MDANAAAASALVDVRARAVLFRALFVAAAIAAILLLGAGSSEADEAAVPAERSGPAATTNEGKVPADREARHSPESPAVQGETPKNDPAENSVRKVNDLASDKPARVARATARVVADAGSAAAEPGPAVKRLQGVVAAAEPIREELARTLEDASTFITGEVRTVVDSSSELTATLLSRPAPAPAPESAKAEVSPEPATPREVAVPRERGARTPSSALVESALQYIAPTRGDMEFVDSGQTVHGPSGLSLTAPAGCISAVGTGSEGSGSSPVAGTAEATILVAPVGLTSCGQLDDWLPRTVDRQPGFSPD